MSNFNSENYFKHFMKHDKFLNSDAVSALVQDFKTVLEQGTVTFQEESVFMTMIDYCFETGLLQEGIIISENALLQYPFSTDILVRLTKISIKMKFFNKCNVTLQRLAAVSPQNVDNILLTVESLAAQNKCTEALEVLHTANEMTHFANEDRAELFLLQARILYSLGRDSDAFDALKHCLLLNADNKPAYTLMFWVVERTGLYEESIVFYNKLISKNAYNSKAWLNLGHAHAALDEQDEAMEAFGFCFAIDEKCLDAYMESGDILLQHEQYKEAQSLYERALLFCGPYALVYQKLGICFAYNRRIKRAHEFFIKSLELDPSNAETHFQLGKCAGIAGKWSLAVRALENAVALQEDFEDYQVALGAAYVKIESFLNAMKCFRRATIIAPENIDMWLKYIQFLIGVGQIKTALKIIDEAELNTGMENWIFYRIGCLFTLGKNEEAGELLYEYSEKNYDNSSSSFFKFFPNLEHNASFLAVLDTFRIKHEV